MTNHPNTSQQISSQLPRFVKANHPMFVSFLEAYYEWLDGTGEHGSFEGGLDVLSQRDIDKTFDDFIEYFKKEYLLNFPKNLAVDVEGNPLDVRNLIKNIRQFYRAKGTEKSYEFLFRILYNSAVEFYYPKEDILKISDGRWVERTSIKTTATNGPTLFELLGNEVRQRNDSGVVIAYGRVSDIQIYPVDGVEIAEFFLSGIFGTFEHTRNIEGIAVSTGETLTERTHPVVSNITITNGGEDYQPGETIKLKPSVPGSDPVGSGFLARIDEVDTQNSLYKTDEEIQLGSIKGIRIIDFGFNYKDLTEWQVVVNSPFGSGAVFDISIGGMSSYPGYYEGTGGQLSSSKKIQDSNYYQQFSYVLRVETSYENWISAIKKIIHPAGMEVFGEVLLYRRRINTIDASHNELRVYENPLIGHYTPYRFETYENLRNNSQGVDLYPQGYNPWACHIDEWGTTGHNPYNIPSGLDSSYSGPLFANIDDIEGHNAHCPYFDINNLEEGEEVCGITGWHECDKTPFATTTTGGVTGDYGCCREDYWIIYPHPNSRDIDYIPEEITIKRLWLYDVADYDDGAILNEFDPGFNFSVHENIHQKRREESIITSNVHWPDEEDTDGKYLNDLRPFVNQQVEDSTGRIFDYVWYGASGPEISGPGGTERAKIKLDILPNTPDFLGDEYRAAVTGYYLQSQYSDVEIELNTVEGFGGMVAASNTNFDFIKANAILEEVTVPNPFLHIMINDFFHMPINSGITGNPYQHRSTIKHNLEYESTR